MKDNLSRELFSEENKDLKGIHFPKVPDISAAESNITLEMFL
jgi:hypothetical protein